MGTERHPFEPFLPRMLFLGSFPPQPHRWSMPFYYPNWINDFWRIMGLIHFGDKDHFCIPAEKRFDEVLIRQFCAEEGLAFYDTACEVRRLRDNASDAFLEGYCHHRRKGHRHRRRTLWLPGAGGGELCGDSRSPSLLAHALLLPRLSPSAGAKGRILSAAIPLMASLDSPGWYEN